jgi:tol-pal system protein YbgF
MARSLTTTGVALAAAAVLAGCAAQSRSGASATESADLRRMLLETRRDLEEVRRDQDKLRDAVENLQAQRAQSRPSGTAPYGEWSGQSLGIESAGAAEQGATSGEAGPLAPPTGSPDAAAATGPLEETGASTAAGASEAEGGAAGGAEIAAASASPVPAPLGVSTPPPMVPTSLRGSVYEEAVEAFNDEHFEDSIQYFRDFVYKNPESEYADDAQYWIGESYLRKQLYSNAIKEFNQVVLRYAQSDRGASALLKLADVFSRIGDQVDARLSLQKLVNRYPGSDEAAEAYRLLKQMGT